jgi:hypothetical protein
MDVMDMAVYTKNNAIASVLRRLIDARKTEIKDRLASGVAISTIESYREVVGTLKGLDDALALLDDAEIKVEER